MSFYHNCLKGPRSKCPACIEARARQSAEMRGETDPAPWRGEAALILEAIEDYRSTPSTRTEP